MTIKVLIIKGDFSKGDSCTSCLDYDVDLEKLKQLKGSIEWYVSRHIIKGEDTYWKIKNVIINQ